MKCCSPILKSRLTEHFIISIKRLLFIIIICMRSKANYDYRSFLMKKNSHHCHLRSGRTFSQDLKLLIVLKD